MNKLAIPSIILRSRKNLDRTRRIEIYGSMKPSSSELLLYTIYIPFVLTVAYYIVNPLTVLIERLIGGS